MLKLVSSERCEGIVLLNNLSRDGECSLGEIGEREVTDYCDYFLKIKLRD